LKLPVLGASIRVVDDSSVPRIVNADPRPSPSPTGEIASVGSGDLDRLTLRFTDARLETDFRAALYRDVIGSVRAAFLLGIATWALWGLVIRQLTLDAPDLDLIIRFLVLIPILVVGLVITFLPFGRRIWEAEAVLVLVLNALIWTLYVSSISGVPFDLGYVGVILIMAFSYTLLRLRFVLMAGTGLVMIALYFVATIATGAADRQQLTLATFYLVSFYVLGGIASYTLERFTRLLFLRERQLEYERARSEALLLNVLPQAIAQRLMERAEVGADPSAQTAVLADEHPEVAVLFADLAGFTEQAGRTSPEALVATLNDLFSEMDLLADTYGLEKIKTAGDAYMAVAGVPGSVPDPAARAVSMALDLVTVLNGRRWPSGDPVGVRVGIAMGPAVAGVIGRRKFAYDVWGDTVNLASRLQAAGRAGRVLVAESVAERTSAHFDFEPVEYVELKGKGSQPVRFVLGRTLARAKADVINV
jgi:class 3 adenylate cyclase